MTKGPMDLTVVSSIDPSSSKPGGTRSYVMYLLKFLEKRPVDISLIGVSHNSVLSENAYRFSFVPIAKGFQISSYKYLLKLFIKSPFLKIPKSSIIHAQREDHLLPFILFHRKNRTICTLHGVSGKKIALKKGNFVGFFYKLIENYTLRRVDRLIAVDESTKEYYLEKYPWLTAKIKVIPVGIDLELFRSLDKIKMRQKYNLKTTDKVIIYVGRFEKEKNLDFLIRCFEKLEKISPDYRLILVGSGKALNSLKELSVDMGLKNVEFFDPLEQHEVPEILNCADVFALCSLFESGPLVVQEAIACGIPVVTTNVGRVEEFITDEKVGTIVKYDEGIFSNALKEILSCKSDYSSYRQKIAEEFRFELTMQSVLEVYEDISENDEGF